MGWSTEVKLGAFVAATSLAFAFLILTFGEIPLFKPKMKEYVVYFEDVGGLSVGAEVRVSGDASAQIGTLGLMGDKFLAVYPGNPKLGELKEGEEILSSEGVADTDRLIRELTRTAEGFRLVAENLNRILQENRENLHLIAQMSTLTESLNRTLPSAIASVEKLSEELRGIASENREDIRALIANLKSISDDLKGDLPALVSNLNDLAENLNSVVSENRDDIRKTLANLSDITEKLRRSSQRLDNILHRIESGKGTIGKLVTDEELYESVTRGARLFGEAGEVITKTRIFVGFGGEAYSQGDAKGYMSLRVQPERKTYYLLELVGDSRGRVYTEQIVGGEEIVKKEFKPELTLQIAKNFFIGEDRYLTVRAGLKESTGGVGFDIIPHRNVRIYSDIWDTGRKDRPGEGGLNGDDLLNDRLRGAFLGVGMDFSEDHLIYY